MNDNTKRAAHRPIALRAATEADCTALTRLAMASKAHWGYDDDFMKACAATLKITPAFLAEHHVMVAEAPVYEAEAKSDAETEAEGDACADRSSELLGFYALTPERLEVEVAQCFVAPIAIGKGIGAELWRDLEHFALSQGATALTVLSDPNAAGFYRRMGMTDAGQEPSDVFGSARPLPVLKKLLSARCKGRSSH